MEVILLNNIHSKKIPSQKKFQEWVDTVAEIIPEKIPDTCNEVCISIVDEKESAQLNENYRHKNGPTNVLSFAYENTSGVLQESLGDLAICAAVVEDEAIAQNKSLESHWAHMTVHGVLHLAGYDHMIDSDAEIMELLETEILKKLGFESPY